MLTQLYSPKYKHKKIKLKFEKKNNVDKKTPSTESQIKQFSTIYQEVQLYKTFSLRVLFTAKLPFFSIKNRRFVVSKSVISWYPSTIFYLLKESKGCSQLVSHYDCLLEAYK